MVGRRSVLARIGVTLLNFVAPGLGLLRVGNLRAALLVYGTALAAVLALIFGLSLSPNISFGAYAALVMLVLCVSLAAYVLAIWWTWRESRIQNEPRQVWARWYSIVGAALGAFAISWVLTGVSQSFYHNFYAPSEGMEPSLIKGDRFVASMRPGNEFHRGDMLLVETSEGATYVKRLAALPRDRIGLKDGTVFINGVAASLSPQGVSRVSYPYRPQSMARIFREKFPGEIGSHLIQDLGASEEDNLAETVVAPRRLFFLGDNRDDSADSRVPEAMGGLEQVPIERVSGRPLLVYWPFAKMGRALRAADGVTR